MTTSTILGEVYVVAMDHQDSGCGAGKTRAVARNKVTFFSSLIVDDRMPTVQLGKLVETTRSSSSLRRMALQSRLTTRYVRYTTSLHASSNMLIRDETRVRRARCETTSIDRSNL